MFIPFAPLAFGALVMVSAVDPVPVLDTRPTCADVGADASVTRTVDLCEQSEKQARDTLAAEWNKFSGADRARCVATTRIGGFPSYVQVLTCLEIARDASTMKVD